MFDERGKKWSHSKPLEIEENDPKPLLTNISPLFVEARDSGILPIDEEGNMDGVRVDFNPIPEFKWRVVIRPDHDYFGQVGSILGGIGFEIKEEKHPEGKPVTFVLKKTGSSDTSSSLWTIQTGSY